MLVHFPVHLVDFIRLMGPVWLLSAQLTATQRDCAAAFSLRGVALSVQCWSVDQGCMLHEGSHICGEFFYCAQFDVDGESLPSLGRVRSLVHHTFGKGKDDWCVYANCDWFRQPVTDVAGRIKSPYLDMRHVVAPSEGTRTWVNAKQLVTQVVSIEGHRVYLLQA